MATFLKLPRASRPAHSRAAPQAAGTQLRRAPWAHPRADRSTVRYRRLRGTGRMYAAQTGTHHHDTGTGEQQRRPPSLDGTTGERAVFVRFRSGRVRPDPAGRGPLPRAGTRQRAGAGAGNPRQRVQQQGASAAKESGAQVLHTTHNAMRGVALTHGNVEQIRALANRDDVERISIVVEDMAPRVSAAPSLIRTRSPYGRRARRTRLHRLHRQGREDCRARCRYRLHARRFGRPRQAFEERRASDTLIRGAPDPKKFLGGYDLVGDDYNSGKKETSRPTLITTRSTAHTAATLYTLPAPRQVTA